jgi:hypothetical protein
MTEQNIKKTTGFTYFSRSSNINALIAFPGRSSNSFTVKKNLFLGEINAGFHAKYNGR